MSKRGHDLNKVNRLINFIYITFLIVLIYSHSVYLILGVFFSRTSKMIIKKIKVVTKL